MPVPLFRAMKAAPDGMPACEDSARGLGARVPQDIEGDAAGFVTPKQGGMSVTPDNPERMNPLRRPRALGGVGKDPLFVIGEERLGTALIIRRDPKDPRSHGFVEPANVMPLDTYRTALAATRPGWRPA